MKQDRDSFDGPRWLDSEIELREDFYSFAYLHYVKYYYMFGEEEPV